MVAAASTRVFPTMMRNSRLGALALMAFLGCCIGSRAADPEPLRFGMSTALTGPTSDLGLGMRAGVTAAMEEQNRRGGVQGQRLELIVLDDGYEPMRTAPNMRELIEDHRVLGAVGNVGTPTAVAAIPIANETRTPFIGAFTGAGVLRKSPPDRFVINYRASYAEETSAMVEELVRHGIRPNEVAFFTQRDAYGDAGFAGGAEALERYEPGVSRRIAHGFYDRNTVAVEGGLADLMMHQPAPKAVIMVGAYAPCARFIQLADEVGFEARFFNVSFVGASSLARELGALGDGVIVTQVVPHLDSGTPIGEAGRDALDAIDHAADVISLEGYAVGRMLCLALERVEGEITRESIVAAFDSLGEFDLGVGKPLLLSRDRRQASTAVWPTMLRGGRVVAVTWEEALTYDRGNR